MNGSLVGDESKDSSSPIELSYNESEDGKERVALFDFAFW